MARGVRQLVVSAVLAGVLAGSVFAAPSGVGAKKWTERFCGSFLVWEQAAKAGDAKLVRNLNALSKSGGGGNLAAVRSQLVVFLAGVEQATDRLQGSLRALGPPAVTNGSKIEAVVVDGIATTRSGLVRARKRAQALPTGNAAAFVRQEKSIDTAIKSMFSEVTKTFHQLQKLSPPPLTAAARATQACRKLG